MRDEHNRARDISDWKDERRRRREDGEREI